MSLQERFENYIDVNKYFGSMHACRDIGHKAAILDMFNNYSYLFEEFGEKDGSKIFLRHCSGCGYVYDAVVSERLFHMGNPIDPEFAQAKIQLTTTFCTGCYKDIRRPAMHEKWGHPIRPAHP